MNIDLTNHKHKCRCCFKPLKTAQKTVEISKFIEKRFQVLTGIELVQMDFYSNVICESCNSKLSEYADFRQEMIENQTSLYKFEPYEECQLPEEAIVEQFSNESPAKVAEVEEVFQVIETPTTSVIQSLPATFQISRISSVRHNPQKGRRRDCPHCGISVAVNGWYHHILRAHTNEARFKCDVCNKAFRVKNDLREHMQVHLSIGSRPKFPCDSCPSVLLSRSSLKNHQNTFHSDSVEQHPCEQCGKVFISRMKLNQHRLNVHVKGTFPCQFCDKVYTVKAVLQKHITIHHTTKVPCEICNKLFFAGNSLEKHKKCHELGAHPCTVEKCTRMFRSSQSLADHLETDHSGEDVMCQVCGATFTSDKNLNRHISRQHSYIRIRCEVEGCSHSSSRKDYLAAHYRRHRDIDEETRIELLARVRAIKMISW